MPKTDDIETRFRTAGNFTEGLKKGLFTLFCQPIVPVESGKADYKYLEIFVRFREEEDKLLPPGTFFPILEANHLTPLLDRWVVREVLRWTADKQGSQPNWHIRASTSISPTTRFATRISGHRCAISSRRRKSRPAGCGSR